MVVAVVVAVVIVVVDGADVNELKLKVQYLSTLSSSRTTQSYTAY